LYSNEERTNVEKKHENRKNITKGDENNLSIIDMTMGDSNSPKKLDAITVDAETLVAQTQDRIWRALKRGYQYDSTLKPGQIFLLNHVNSRIPFVIMYADLVGSTNMSMTLPVDKFVAIIRAFSFEMSSIVQSHGGYVLKYVGDAIISFFLSSYNKLLACDRAVSCARSMITVIKNGINPILNQYDYPELSVKIGIDEGENIIVQYGHDKSSPIDLLGYPMSITAKITSLTNPDVITIGEDVYAVLHPQIKKKFEQAKYSTKDWRYSNRQTGRLYKLYNLIQ
jgi:adenylate cyclase